MACLEKTGINRPFLDMLSPCIKKKDQYMCNYNNYRIDRWWFCMDKACIDNASNI